MTTRRDTRYAQEAELLDNGDRLGGATSSAGSPKVEPESLGGQLAVFAVDIGAPIAVYYLLHGVGVSNLVALAAGAAVPALGAAWTLQRKRRVDGTAVLVLATIALSLAVSVATHDPRFLLAKEGLLTGLWGLWFLLSAATRRPAALLLARPLMEGRRVFTSGSWDRLWAEQPVFRRIWRVSSVIWGVGLLADAVIRVVISYSLPIDQVPGLGGILWPVTFVVIQVITNAYYHWAGLYRLLGARWLTRR